MLGHEGAYSRTSGKFYEAVIQSLLLFRLDSWVITPQILQELGSIHHQKSRRISSQITQLQNGKWYYPIIGEALVEVGLETIVEYISYHHIIVTQYITMRSIFDLVVAEERQPISPATMLWL